MFGPYTLNFRRLKRTNNKTCTQQANSLFLSKDINYRRSNTKNKMIRNYTKCLNCKLRKKSFTEWQILLKVSNEKKITESWKLKNFKMCFKISLEIAEYKGARLEGAQRNEIKLEKQNVSI